MNQLDLRKSLNEVKKIGYNKNIRELPNKSKKIVKVVENSRMKLSAQQEILENKLAKTEDKNLIQHKKIDISNEHREKKALIESQKKWPGIYVYLLKDRASICIILNRLSLHKHGFRKYISWGPIKETLISGCLAELNFIENCRRFEFLNHFKNLLKIK